MTEEVRHGDSGPSDHVRRVLRLVPDLYLVLDSDGSISYHGESDEEGLDWSEGEFVGRELMELIHPGDRERAAEVHRSALQTPGYTRTVNIRLRSSDGAYRRVELAGRNMLSDESVGGMLLFARDVTESHRTLEALARREEILEALAFTAGQLLRTANWKERVQSVLERLGVATRVDRAYIFEHARDDEGEILASLRYEWVDEGVEPQIDNPELQEVPYREAGFEEWYEAFLRDEAVRGAPEEFSEPIRQFLEAQDIRSVAVVPIRVEEELWGFIGFDECDEERTWSSAETEALQTAARLIGAVIEAGRAQVELERREKRLREAVKMEAVGRLAGGIAHDFNNLLTAIQGYAQLARSEVEADPPVREMIDEIARASDRAGDLVQQLLAYSRQQSLQPVILDINETIRETRNMLGRLLGEDIEIESRLSPDLGLVRVDPGQLEQILLNIAVNARDAMPEGGRLRFETENVELDEPYVQGDFTIEPGRYVALQVTDEGVGMDRATMARVFDPFYTTKELGSGTGLGLATVYGIVKQSGGWIWLYSEPDEGTTFKIYLPRHEGKPTAAGPKPARPVAGGEETILLVEDERGVRRLVGRILAELGYEVVEVAHPRDAIEIQRKGARIHLLLTDVIMPEMGGQELASRLRRNDPDLRVLYMSGYASDRLRVQDESSTEPALLSKPFTPNELARRVREILDTQPG